ncbi:MAG: hypothetical protein BZ138_07465 [Methanosphaera sp. rholeuAM270]|nr:MAG: hypothetical protein BZ138_07465 [Methanosphaera sp. rholeuAM270]
MDDKNSSEYVKEEVWKDYTPGDSITGILVDILYDMGEYGNRLYKIRANDKVVALWGSKDLDEKVDKQDISIGMRIEVTFNGLIRTSNNFDMKDFTVVVLD